MKVVRKILLSVSAAAVAGLIASPAMAEFPERAIEFVIPFGAGGGADIEGRLLAEGMSKVLGKPVVPVNKPGAGGAVTYTYVKNAKPDGYTVAWNSTSILTVTNIGNVPYSYTAMDNIGQVEYQPMVFAVKGNAPWKNLADFAKDCKANPGKLVVANSTTGSATHLAAIAVAQAMGCEVTHLPAGVSRRNATVLSGESQAMVAPLTGAINLAKAKKIRILATLSEKRDAAISNVPTAKEQGYDAVLTLFRGLCVPKGTPEAVKAKLADAMIKAANSAKFKALSQKVGFTIDPLGPKAFDAKLVKENELVVKIMKEAGLYQSKAKK